MPLRLFSVAGFAIILTLASGVILAQVQEELGINKEELHTCIQDAKDVKKDAIQDAKDLYKSERERFSHPKNEDALRAAKINRESDIRLAKDVFKVAREECKDLFH